MAVARKKRLSRCWISWLGNERKNPCGDYKKGRVTGTFRCCQDEKMDFSRMGNKIWKHPSDFTDNSMLGDLVIYAECKKKAPKHPVNVGLVRQLYGTVEADRVTAGIMVTNSYFSKDARRFQQTIKSRIRLFRVNETDNGLQVGK